MNVCTIEPPFKTFIWKNLSICRVFLWIYLLISALFLQRCFCTKNYFHLFVPGTRTQRRKKEVTGDRQNWIFWRDFIFETLTLFLQVNKFKFLPGSAGGEKKIDVKIDQDARALLEMHWMWKVMNWLNCEFVELTLECGFTLNKSCQICQDLWPCRTFQVGQGFSNERKELELTCFKVNGPVVNSNFKAELIAKTNCFLRWIGYNSCVGSKFETKQPDWLLS